MAILKPNSARAPALKDGGRAGITTAPGRPTLPSQLAPVQPGAGSGMKFTPQPVVRPQPANPFQRITTGAPGMAQPPAMGGAPGLGRPPFVTQPPAVTPPAQQPPPQQPPVFNLPSPVPVLGQIQPPAVNLNTTPGQLGNQVTPPAAGMPPAAPLGQAPVNIGGDMGDNMSGFMSGGAMSGVASSSGGYDPAYQQFLQANPGYMQQSAVNGVIYPQRAYGAYQQQMGGGINNLPAMGSEILPQTQY